MGERNRKAVVISGAAGGIGRAFAAEYAAEDVVLLLVDRNEATLAEVAQSISGQKAEVRTIAADLLAEDTNARILSEIEAAEAHCRTLVHAAGVFLYQDLLLADRKRVMLIHELHTTQPLRLTLDLLDQISSDGKGEIIAMSSMARRIPFPGLNMYSATKAYVSNLMQSLHDELWAKGVRVLSCEPGAVDTTLYGLPENYRRLALALRVAITPQQLAKGAIKAARRGKTTYTPGLVNHIALPLITHLPDPIVRWIDTKISRFKK